MNFRNQEEREAWVRFAAAAYKIAMNTTPYHYGLDLRESAAVDADALLAEFRKRVEADDAEDWGGAEPEETQ